jgi:hypothetical protein
MAPVNGLRTGLAAPGRRRRPPWVRPLIATAIAVLLGGLWEGLVYMRLPLPAGNGTMSQDHGQLMVLGFLGTLIALERAVALGETWGYLAPAAAGAGGLAIIAGAPGDVGEALIGCGGLVLVAVFAAVYRIQPSLHNAVLASAAACWVVAAGLWLAGWDISRFVPWLAGFLVLTITGDGCCSPAPPACSPPACSPPWPPARPRPTGRSRPGSVSPVPGWSRWPSGWPAMTSRAAPSAGTASPGTWPPRC